MHLQAAKQKEGFEGFSHDLFVRLVRTCRLWRLHGGQGRRRDC